MSVNWEALGICHRCLSPEGKHHVSCPSHPLGAGGRQDVLNTMDYDLQINNSEIEKVVRFARAVLAENLYRITQPCPFCSLPERVLCAICHHPAGAHKDNEAECLLFPACGCDGFKPKECECRAGRVIPSELIEAVRLELGVNDDAERVESWRVREALFALEAVLLQNLEEL